MAYVPPHKRNSKENERKSSSTPYVDYQLQLHMNLRKVRYESTWQPHSKWFIIPSIDASQHSEDDTRFPSSLPLKIIKWDVQDDSLIIVSDSLEQDSHPSKDNNDAGEFSTSNVQKQTESIENGSGLQPTIFVCNYLPRKVDGPRKMEVYEIINNSVNSPWRCIEKEIQGDLVSSFQNLRNEMYNTGSGLKISPSFIVKLGTNFFGGEGVDLESVNNSSFKKALNDLYRGHSSYISSSSKEFIRNVSIPKIGFKFHAKKEYYHIKVIDKYRKGYYICKCVVNKAVGELDLCKIEWTQRRHLILDVSYLEKKVEPRLMLSAKRLLTTTPIAEDLRELVRSAIIDSNEKGGLRWPVKNNPVGNRYIVDEVLHTNSVVLKCSTMRLKARHIDEINYATSCNHVRNQVILRMTEIENKLNDEAAELDSIIGMVNDTLKLLWEEFP